MKLGNGIAPIYDMLKTYINVCIGTNGAASDNNLDLFEEMKIMALAQKVKYLDPKALTCSRMLKNCNLHWSQCPGL